MVLNPKGMLHKGNSKQHLEMLLQTVEDLMPINLQLTGLVDQTTIIMRQVLLTIIEIKTDQKEIIIEVHDTTTEKIKSN
jgi:hypothetical protein